MAGIESIVNVVYGAIGGAVTTFVALRTRLALMQRDDKDMTAALERLEARVNERLEQMDRRTIAALELAADCANKEGVNRRGRGSDVVARFLANGDS